MKKINDIVIYTDDNYYSAFPSIVSSPDGELLVAFRRAPDRRDFFVSGISHTDPNSYLMMVRSRDLGRNWSEPELIYAHPQGGSQDPCMVQLDDESLLLTSYYWMFLAEGKEKCEQNGIVARTNNRGTTYVPLGGYLLKSNDCGQSWKGPLIPPQVNKKANSFSGMTIPAYNRGAMTQGSDGNLYWAVAHFANFDNRFISLLVSKDRGLSWEDYGEIARDTQVGFNETSMIETVNGDLIAFVRTENFDDHGVVVRSQDHGKSWEPWQDMGIIGHPYHALRLPDNRVFLVYGYRHEPYGIRARIIDEDCRNFDGEEIIIRDDGGNGDLGYPWSCLTNEGKVLVVYYFNKNDGTRHIAGTFLEI